MLRFAAREGVPCERVRLEPLSLAHPLPANNCLSLVVKSALMAETTDPDSFEEIVEWAYRTLPEKVRRLPDFPGIQVVDEPPAEGFAEMSSERKWQPGTELLGLYSGTLRTKQSFYQLKYAPDLIWVFRGPILRYITHTKKDLRTEVKRVVWHEVAHWLGFETEEQVKALGL